MSRFYEALRELLAQEKSLYAEAVGVSRSKKEAVLNGQVAELDALVRSEQGLLVRMQTAERRRMDCVGDYAARTGRAARDVTLSEMVDSAPAGERVSLAELHEELRGLLETLRALGEENRQLVESRLEYTRFMLSVLTEEDGASHTYTSRGAEHEAPPARGLMDLSV